MKIMVPDMANKNKILGGEIMKLYIKQCRPFHVSFGGQGFGDTWTPLEDWQDEDNESMLRENIQTNYYRKKIVGLR